MNTDGAYVHLETAPVGQLQTMMYIVEQCPLTRLEGGLKKLNSADDDATAWLGQVRIR